jgi:DNA-binding NarL/FixJ family response regulator
MTTGGVDRTQRRNGARVRVVLADDHELVRSGLRSLLEGAGGIDVVGEARNGEQALRAASAVQPDVLVMDVTMPVLDGVRATRRVREECPDVKVLALTMHDDRGHLTRLLEAGAAGYVLKTAGANELVRAIRVVANGGRYIDPVLAGSMLGPGAAKQPPLALAQENSALSGREEDTLRRIAWGQTNKEIGIALGISTKTVETYKARIGGKLGLRSRADMVRYALRHGWLVNGD